MRVSGTIPQPGRIPDVSSISNNDSGLSVRTDLNATLARSDDIVNAQAYGSKGDGATDDTATLQAAFTAAFGSIAAPHGGNNSHLNRPVFLPAGRYMVGANVVEKVVTGTASAGAFVAQAHITGASLIFESLTSGAGHVGQVITGVGVAPYTIITGGSGNSWTITPSQTVPSTQIYTFRDGQTPAIILSLSDTAGLVTGDNVYVRGIVGTTFANYSYSIAVLDGTRVTLAGTQYNAPWISGGTLATAALRLPPVRGAWIYGAGRNVTSIINTHRNSAVISTNGCEFAHIEGISWYAGDGGICFDLNYDGVINNQVNLQSNFFENNYFGTTGSDQVLPDYGVAVGMGQNMGSENTFLNNFFGGCRKTSESAGLYVHNYNALMNTVIGGNISGCSYGIYVNAGSVPSITGVSFQNGTGIDIYVINGGPDQYSIQGCRTESGNFLKSASWNVFDVGALSHSPGTAQGYIFSGAGQVTCRSIVSVAGGGGWFEGTASLSISNGQFVRADYLTHGPQSNYRYLDVTPQRIITETASRSMVSADSSAKIQFNSTSAQTYTVLKNSDGACALRAGSRVGLQQIGAGQLTVVPSAGVTIRSSRGFKLRAQWSCATLTCDGTDLWTLDGDTII